MAFGCLQALQRRARPFSNHCCGQLSSIQLAHVVMMALSGSWTEGWERVLGGSLSVFLFSWGELQLQAEKQKLALISNSGTSQEVPDSATVPVLGVVSLFSCFQDSEKARRMALSLTFLHLGQTVLGIRSAFSGPP